LLTATLERADKMAETEQWLRRAADAGDIDATRRLIAFLERADRVADAEQWLRRAAGRGNAEAILEMDALLRRIGRAAEADRWLREEADGGNTPRFGGWLSCGGLRSAALCLSGQPRTATPGRCRNWRN
jgi:TPR repeat protein